MPVCMCVCVFESIFSSRFIFMRFKCPISSILTNRIKTKDLIENFTQSSHIFRQSLFLCALRSLLLQWWLMLVLLFLLLILFHTHKRAFASFFFLDSFHLIHLMCIKFTCATFMIDLVDYFLEMALFSFRLIFRACLCYVALECVPIYRFIIAFTHWKFIAFQSLSNAWCISFSVHYFSVCFVHFFSFPAIFFLSTHILGNSWNVELIDLCFRICLNWHHCFEKIFDFNDVAQFWRLLNCK